MNDFKLLGITTLEDAFRVVDQVKEISGTTFKGATGPALKNMQEAVRQSRQHRTMCPWIRSLDDNVAKRDEKAGAIVETPQMAMLRETGGVNVDPRAVRQRPKPEQREYTSPDWQQLRQAVAEGRQHVDAAAQQVSMAEKAINSTSHQDIELAAAARASLEAARKAVSDADTALGSPFALARLQAETPVAEKQREQKEAEEEERSKRIRQALRLLRRIEAAISGKQNPYAESDRRRTRRRRQESIHDLLRNELPDLFQGQDVDVEAAEGVIDEELGGEGKLCDIL